MRPEEQVFDPLSVTNAPILSAIFEEYPRIKQQFESNPALSSTHDAPLLLIFLKNQELLEIETDAIVSMLQYTYPKIFYDFHKILRIMSDFNYCTIDHYRALLSSPCEGESLEEKYGIIGDLLEFACAMHFLNITNFSTVYDFFQQQYQPLNEFMLLISDHDHSLHAQRDDIKWIASLVMRNIEILLLLNALLNTRKTLNELQDNTLSLMVGYFQGCTDEEVVDFLQSENERYFQFHYLAVPDNIRKILLSNTAKIHDLAMANFELPELFSHCGDFSAHRLAKIFSHLNSGNISFLEYFLSVDIPVSIIVKHFLNVKAVDILSDIYDALWDQNNVSWEAYAAIYDDIKGYVVDPTATHKITRILKQCLIKTNDFCYIDTDEPIREKFRQQRASLELILNAGLSISDFAKFPESKQDSLLQDITVDNAYFLEFFQENLPRILFLMIVLNAMDLISSITEELCETNALDDEKKLGWILSQLDKDFQSIPLIREDELISVTRQILLRIINVLHLESQEQRRTTWAVQRFFQPPRSSSIDLEGADNHLQF